MPAAFVIGAVSAAALTLRNIPGNEVLDCLVNCTADPKEYFDVVCTEQVNCPGTHASGEDMRNIVPGKEHRQFSRLMSRAFKDFPGGDPLIFDAEHCVFSTVAEMFGDIISVFCDSNFHEYLKNIVTGSAVCHRIQNHARIRRGSCRARNR
jgi:hypothetical protein